ncbi:glycosyltransferase involved in cell wall biosynthesis [Dyadobacter jejuensis]|uniref:Glycosyltransferase involved in cell wall biosynthesis n=1 Tax=Dyadobacter jejuensis TaxID=1082580 RepID=A0A316AR50_9BACT|nr:glycosyltransferase [Dyadobacter jejuensis]PWJ59856.1 glycosyltransferase involved in cell wall biosynthesis [Dyadobacter jejuensis]
MTRRVLLLSTIHPPTDPRIVYKIAPALSNHFQVFCCLPNAPATTHSANIRFISLPYYQGLVSRILWVHLRALLKCWAIRPHIVHIFVPELIPIAFLFRWAGAKVIYEIQENLSQKFSIKTQHKSYLFRTLWALWHRMAIRNFALVLTEDAYLKSLPPTQHPVAVIHNYVDLDFVDRYASKDPTADFPVFFYCGVLSLERSFDTMLEAFALLKKEFPKFKVHLFGQQRLSNQTVERLMSQTQVEANLLFYGYTDLKIALAKAADATAGIALLKPLADYPDSYSTKIFEYMALQLPVITSNFELYRKVVEKHACGFCIDPSQPIELANKLRWLYDNPDKALQMGENGRNAAASYYNWSHEQLKLIRLYEQL